MMKRNPAKLTRSEEIRLTAVYYDPSQPGGLASISALVAATKIPRKKVKMWLMKQPTYTLHRVAYKRYPTRKYYVNAIDDQWQMDLVDMVQVQRKTRVSDTY